MKASRWIIVVVAVAALVGLFVVLRPSGEAPDGADPSAEPVAISIQISDGEISGAETTTPIALGSPVTIEVRSDTDGSAHLHGYEILGEATPETPAVLEFTADTPGRFDLMFHDSSGETPLTQLEVS